MGRRRHQRFVQNVDSSAEASFAPAWPATEDNLHECPRVGYGEPSSCADATHTSTACSLAVGHPCASQLKVDDVCNSWQVQTVNIVVRRKEKRGRLGNILSTIAKKRSLSRKEVHGLLGNLPDNPLCGTLSDPGELQSSERRTSVATSTLLFGSSNLGSLDDLRDMTSRSTSRNSSPVEGQPVRSPLRSPRLPGMPPLSQHRSQTQCVAGSSVEGYRCHQHTNCKTGTPVLLGRPRRPPELLEVENLGRPACADVPHRIACQRHTYQSISRQDHHDEDTSSSAAASTDRHPVSLDAVESSPLFKRRIKMGSKDFLSQVPSLNANMDTG